MRRGLKARKRRRQVIGETAIWSSIVGLVGAATLSLPAGLALAVGFGTAHLRVRKRESDAPRPAVAAWFLVVLPAVVGITLATQWIGFSIIFAPGLFVLWFCTPLPRHLGPRVRSRLAGVAVVAATVWLCAISPKHLDRRVGPAHYRAVSLRELCKRLRQDQDIDCHVDRGVGAQRLDFDIPRPMTRREVLRKLADQTGLRLHLRGCGTGATLLWGSYVDAHLSRGPGAPSR